MTNPHSHSAHSITSEKFISWLGRFASVIAILSYIAQIINNLHGQYGSPVQPFVAGINCTLWSIYAYFKEDRDWPVFWANFPGIFFSFATCLTSFTW